MPTEFHLYRAKFIRPKQLSFLEQDETSSSLFVKSIMERPSFAFRQEYNWHIANIHTFTGTSGYFAIGRSSPTSIPRLDATTGDFVDTEDDTSPYTYVVYDASIGLMAIQRSSELAPFTNDIATKIARLLSITDIISRNEIDVKIDVIPDPDDFISRLQNAHAIKRFTATFTGPNPFDADEYFQKPLSVYLNMASGDHGAATIDGSHLDPEVVTAVARSTAATGNKASAKVQTQAGARPVRINLSGDPVKLAYEEDSPLPSAVLADAQAAYKNVRHERD